MHTLTAKKQTQYNPPERCTEAVYGYTMWTLFTSDPFFPYSLGYLREDHGTHEPQGVTLYNYARKDWAHHHNESIRFATMAEALAYVRSWYDAEADRHLLAWEGIATLLDADPSPIEGSGPEHFIMDFIDCTHYGAHQRIVTAQQALTALDWLSERSARRWTPTVIGAVVPGQQPAMHRHAYAGWTIPTGSQNYHLSGWRSTTGQARAHSTRAA